MGEVIKYQAAANELAREIVEKIERDLRSYPDWIIRLEVGGLGVPQRCAVVGGIPPSGDRHSYVEDEAELSEEIRRKVIVIERVYDRLHGKVKDIIEFRYFQDYNRDEVIRMLAINSKRQYYNLLDRAMNSFARAFGYID